MRHSNRLKAPKPLRFRETENDTDLSTDSGKQTVSRGKNSKDLRHKINKKRKSNKSSDRRDNAKSTDEDGNKSDRSIEMNESLFQPIYESELEEVSDQDVMEVSDNADANNNAQRIKSVVVSTSNRNHKRDMVKQKITFSGSSD